jgi:hypothetical protein
MYTGVKLLTSFQRVGLLTQHWQRLLLLALLAPGLAGLGVPMLFGHEPSSAPVMLDLEMPSEVRAGEPLLLRMTYKNTHIPSD